ncbi:MAG: tripartite tricarboxylate transporter permease [Thermodesulfobacteriota bacterium]
MEQFLGAFYANFQGQNLLMMAIGVVIGMVVGILPGIGGVQAMILMIPLTWKMGVYPAFALIVSIYATSKFGGSLTAILFNIPGDNPNAVTLIDGFPMAKNGKARTAISASATVSIIGGIFSCFSLLVFMPLMYQIILLFGPAEFFMLALFGLTTISAVSAQTILKGILTGCMGILIATIGYHPIVGVSRFTLNTLYLRDGIYMVPVMLGMLGISEAIKLWMEGSSIVSKGVPLTGSITEGVIAAFKNWSLVIRSCLIAWVIGIAPGAGGAVAGFVAYGSATKTCKNPETFGKGDIRGVIAGDTALHACAGGDFLPTITIGIPGSTAMAILLAALALHGISPGPQLMKMRIDLVYFIILVFFIAHVVSVISAIGFTPLVEKLTKLRAELISPIIILLCLVASYNAREYWEDILVVLFFGILGYYMRKHGYHPIPLVLGLILGPIAEKSFFQTLALSKTGILVFFTRIPSLILFLCILTIVLWPYAERFYKKRKKRVV